MDFRFEWDAAKAEANLRRHGVHDEMLPEYDFSGGVRGKYAERYARAKNVVVLDPDVAEAFPDSESVNRALRALAATAREQRAHDPAT